MKNVGSIAQNFRERKMFQLSSFFPIKLIVNLSLSSATSITELH